MTIKMFVFIMLFNLVWSIFMLRACYFIFIKKADPLNSIIPNLKILKRSRILRKMFPETLDKDKEKRSEIFNKLS